MGKLVVMRVQDSVKRVVKGILFRGGSTPRTVRHGPGKGVVLVLSRQSDLQREFGLHEIETHRALRELVQPGMTVYDVGAADGDTSLMLAQLVGPSGRVIALEPSTSEVAKLRTNLDHNPTLQGRIQVQTVWLGSASGTGPDGQPRRRGDELVQSGDLPIPDFMKVDVDGGELEVLEGMEVLLATHHPKLLVETHSRELEQECMRLLEHMGYNVTIIQNAWWRALYPEMRPIAHNRWFRAE